MQDSPDNGGGIDGKMQESPDNGGQNAGLSG